MGGLAIDWSHPQAELDRLKGQLEAWQIKQPPFVEITLATLMGSTQGAVLGGVMGAMTKLDPEGAGKLLTPPTGGNPQMADQMAAMRNQSPLVQARNFAVMTGVNAGLTLAIKKYRKGKEDCYGAMGAAFGSGAAFSLVSSMTPAGQNPFMAAISTGVLFALLQGAIYKLGESFSGPKIQDINYSKAKHLLTTVGYPQYEKQLKKAQLTDNTIMLWNESALREARIPPGPRLLILHHIDQFRQPGSSGRQSQLLKPAMPVDGKRLG